MIADNFNQKCDKCGLSKTDNHIHIEVVETTKLEPLNVKFEMVRNWSPDFVNFGSIVTPCSEKEITTWVTPVVISPSVEMTFGDQMAIYGYPENEEIADNEPNYPLGEFDATKWAPEFKKVGVREGFLPADIDDGPGGWLHVWFASCMMTGYDEGRIREREATIDLDAPDNYWFWGV